MTDRAVSVTVNYVLSLAITTLLVGGLLFAAGDVVGDRRDAVVRGELSVVGERVVAGLATADRLAQSGADTVALDVEAPDRVANQGYTIGVNGTAGSLRLATEEPAVRVSIPLGNRTPVADSTVQGGDVRVVLTAAGELEVRSA